MAFDIVTNKTKFKTFKPKTKTFISQNPKGLLSGIKGQMESSDPSEQFLKVLWGLPVGKEMKLVHLETTITLSRSSSPGYYSIFFSSKDGQGCMQNLTDYNWLSGYLKALKDIDEYKLFTE